MNRNENIKVGLLFCVGLANVTCGGGGSDPAQGGDIIDRSGVTVGTISAFGSVFLNGIRFDTRGAEIVVDDVLGAESDLAVGQVVTVRGTVNGASGVANTISTDPIVKGPITEIDPAAGVFVVLQTRLIISPTTSFDPNIGSEALGALRVGERVEAYGYPNASGNILATLVRRSTDTELEFSGVISSLDDDNFTFNIGAQVIDFASAQLVGTGGEALANGDFVEVEGDLLDINNRLVADRVELELDQQFSASDEGTELELEGLITRFASDMDFSLGSVTVSANAGTEYSGGDSNDLATDVFVEVEGTINADGVLMADEVEFKQAANLMFEAPVDSIDGQMVTLVGIEFRVTPTTQFVDRSSTMNRTFGLADLMVNDFVQVNAAGTTGDLIVKALERQDSRLSSIIQGEVTSFTQPDLILQSFTVVSSAATEYQIGGSEVDVSEFFDELESNEEVRVVIDSNNNGVLQAAKMFLDF